VKKWSWTVAVVLTGASMLAGCGPKSIQAGGGPDLSNMMTVQDMAARLGLGMASATQSTASLRDTYNYVTVCGGSSSRVYVNGQEIAAGRHIQTTAGGLMVSEELVVKVRSMLRPMSARPAPSPGTAVPPPELTPPPAAVRGTIVIDPGHGGDDPGARSRNGLVEKDLVLDVALELADLLRQQGARVILTRGDDRFVELEERAAIANRAGADLFVSIHADSAPRNRAAQGVTTWISRAASRQSAAVAGAICNGVESAGLACRGTNRANYKVLVATRCPAVLAEIGFLSNAPEARRLEQAGYRSRLAAALAAGIGSNLSSYARR